MNQYLTKLVAIAASILFAASSLRHLLLHSAAADLAAFDQYAYLLSQNLPPISSIFAVHLLGDHASFILYPISGLYRIYPSVYWLLLIQAIALALGAVPLYAISRLYNLSEWESRSIATAYILYPALFNTNFYSDFKPETIAVPACLWAVWAAMSQKTGQLAIAMAIVLSCKERLGAMVLALGLWFCLSHRTRIYGWCCIAAGGSWLVFTIKYLIPLFRTKKPSGVELYASLGSSPAEISTRLILNPTIVLERLVMPDRLGYCLLLVLPVILGLHWRAITALIPAAPEFVLNILSDNDIQRDLIHHYTLAIFPFIFVWLVQSLALYRQQHQRQWLKPRWLVVWAAIGFLVLGKYGYFWTRYLSNIGNLSSIYTAISQVADKGPVLTNSHICPHLSHRERINPTTHFIATPERLRKYNYILLDIRQLQKSELPVSQWIKSQLQKAADFRLIYQHNDVWLWNKKVN